MQETHHPALMRQEINAFTGIEIITHGSSLSFLVPDVLLQRMPRVRMIITSVDHEEKMLIDGNNTPLIYYSSMKPNNKC